MRFTYNTKPLTNNIITWILLAVNSNNNLIVIPIIMFVINIAIYVSITSITNIYIYISLIYHLNGSTLINLCSKEGKAAKYIIDDLSLTKERANIS